jgi:WD40 repeat protein
MKREDRPSVRMWDSISGDELFALPDHLDGDVLAVFSPDGKKLFTDSDGQVKHTTNFFFGSQTATSSSGTTSVGRIWDAASGKPLATLEAYSTTIDQAIFSADGAQLLTVASRDASTRLWDTASGKLLQVFNSGVLNPFASDARQFVTRTTDGAEVRQMVDPEKVLLLRSTPGVRVSATQFSPDGRKLLIGYSDQSAKVWEVETGKEIATLAGYKRDGFNAAFSPDGRMVAVATGDRVVRVWSADTGKEIAVLKGHKGAVDLVTFSSDGQWLATASSEDPTPRLWRVSFLLLPSNVNRAN